MHGQCGASWRFRPLDCDCLFESCRELVKLRGKEEGQLNPHRCVAPQRVQSGRVQARLRRPKSVDVQQR